MKTEKTNAMIVNICQSAKPYSGDAMPSRYASQIASNGDWKMKPEEAEHKEYLFSAYQGKVIHAWKIVSFQVLDHLTPTRVRFVTKPIYEGSLELLRIANSDISTTHFTTKYITI
jgi:hypothetical protein